MTVFYSDKYIIFFLFQQNQLFNAHPAIYNTALLKPE